MPDGSGRRAGLWSRRQACYSASLRGRPAHRRAGVVAVLAPCAWGRISGPPNNQPSPRPPAAPQTIGVTPSAAARVRGATRQPPRSSQPASRIIERRRVPRLVQVLTRACDAVHRRLPIARLDQRCVSVELDEPRPPSPLGTAPAHCPPPVSEEVLRDPRYVAWTAAHRASQDSAAALALLGGRGLVFGSSARQQATAASILFTLPLLLWLGRPQSRRHRRDAWGGRTSSRVPGDLRGAADRARTARTVAAGRSSSTSRDATR